MLINFVRLTTVLILLCSVSLPATAAPLDDYYLAAFSEQPPLQTSNPLQKAILLPATDTAETPHCGTPLKHSLTRDWSKLEATTQKTLSKQVAVPALTGEQTVISSGGHFQVHFAGSGSDLPNISAINQYTGLTLTSVTDWANTVASTFETVYYVYMTVRGYHPPPGAIYHVYLRDLSAKKYYGVTTSSSGAPSAGYPYAYSSYIELDKDFTNDIYTKASYNNGTPVYTPLDSLNITSAHEFHHAIQYGYNFYFDIWYAEATSTWFEDELYPNVNQLYNYVPSWFSNSTRSLDTFVMPPSDTSQNVTFGYGYGRWIFNRYLVEQHGADAIKAFWENLAKTTPSNGQDIAMVPLIKSVLSNFYLASFSTDFFNFAKRVYLRNWSSLTDISRIHTYSPQSTYSAFPVTSSDPQTPSVVLPHYSFAYYKFLPATGAPANLSLTINGTSGIKATAFKTSNGIISEYPFTTVAGSTVTVPGFSSSSEVVLLLSNNSDVDGHMANFSTDGAIQNVAEPTGGSVYSTSSSGSASSSAHSSSGGGGCFIATAAYGSYLHPHVQTLRNFRDTWLLTNTAGRAFVALYYQLSPPAADFIARHDIIRLLIRLMLSPLVFALAHPAAAAGLLLIAAGMIIRYAKQSRLRITAGKPHFNFTT